jgi:LysM repeat protein
VRTVELLYSNDDTTIGLQLVKSEDAMIGKRTVQLTLVAVMLFASLAPMGTALAGGNCAKYITVQWGDTLSGIAAYCGTTMDAIRAANPGLGWWLYAGQVLYIPTGTNVSAPVYSQPRVVPTPISTPPIGGTYTVQPGDTIASIATAKGFSVNDLLAVNMQLWNMSYIPAGQIINLPVSGSETPVPATPSTASAYSVIRVTADDGLIVRTGPNRFYPAIESTLVDALRGTSWWYRKNSLTADMQGFLWVEIILPPQVKDHPTGWILVKDTLGHYFTTPNLDLR